MRVIDAVFRVGLKITALSLGWLFLVVLPVGNLLGIALGYAELTDLSFSQCFSANAVRVAAYLLLFFGYLYVVATEVFGSLSLRAAAIKDVLTFKGKNRDRLAVYVGIAVLWLAIWWIVSEMLYVGFATHFMGDCDVGDLECGCDNKPFLLPIYYLTSLFGCYLFVSLYKCRKAG